MVLSVETLRGGAETPKRKSSQQVLDIKDVKDGQGNLMLDAKQRVVCSNHTGDAILVRQRCNVIMEKMISPYENLLGMYIAEKNEGFCRIDLPYRKELTNPHGNFHGGAIASIADTAAVQGLRTIFPQSPYLTVDLAIRFKNPSCSAEIFAEARPRHLKGKFFKTEIKILDKDNKLIAQGEVKSFLPNWKEKVTQSVS